MIVVGYDQRDALTTLQCYGSRADARAVAEVIRAGPSASEAAIEAAQIARAHSHATTPPLPAVAIEAMCSDWWARLHSANAPAAGVGAVRDRTAAALTAARERASPHLDVLRERTSVALSAARQHAAPRIDALRERISSAKDRAGPSIEKGVESMSDSLRALRASAAQKLQNRQPSSGDSFSLSSGHRYTNDHASGSSDCPGPLTPGHSQRASCAPAAGSGVNGAGSEAAHEMVHACSSSMTAVQSPPAVLPAPPPRASELLIDFGDVGGAMDAEALCGRETTGSAAGAYPLPTPVCATAAVNSSTTLNPAPLTLQRCCLPPSLLSRRHSPTLPSSAALPCRCRGDV